MSNPLIGMMAKQSVSNMPSMQMLTQFKQFMQNWNPQAAEQKINEMLVNGQINQQQLEQAKQIAEQYKGLFGL